MNLACCTWALSEAYSGDERAILTQIANVGFTNIDIREQDFKDSASLALIKELGLSINCVSGSFSIPEGAALDHPDPDVRAAAVEAIESSIERADRLGATAAYVVPGEDESPEALERYADSITYLADRAAALGQKMLIEHFPGKGLPTITGTLEYIRGLGNPNLYLLYDIGHAQLSNEDIPSTIAAAGPLLGYFHLDDNDGQDDLHWSLLDGVMTQATLASAFTALQQIGYDGPASLELHWELPDPLDAIQRSWDILQTIS